MYQAVLMLVRDVLMKIFGIFGKGEDYTKEVEDRIIESLKRTYIKGLSLLRRRTNAP